MMFFYEWGQLDNLPPRQQEILTSLTARDQIAAAGHVFQAAYDRSFVDSGKPEKHAAWFRAAKPMSGPLIAIAPKDGGVVQVFQLPDSMEAVMKLLENPTEVKR